MSNATDASNYAAMAERTIDTSSIGDQETDRSLGNEMDAGGSIVVGAPAMTRGNDDAGNNTDGGDSIYNSNYPLQSVVQVKQISVFPSFFLFDISFRIIFNRIIIQLYLQVNLQLVLLNQPRTIQ